MNLNNTSQYEYKAGVRDKVKEIESRLRSGSFGSSTENSQSFDIEDDLHSHSTPNPNPKGNSRQQQSIDNKTDSRAVDVPPALVEVKEFESNPVKAPDMTSAPEAKSIATDQSNKSSSKNYPSADHLSKQKNASIKVNHDDDSEIAKLESRNSSPKTQMNMPPKPAPRRLTSRRQDVRNEMESIENSVSRRSSSEDDGIADMASESDPFDDSTIPLPKIKENAFYVKDRGEGENFGRILTGLPPLSPRRASFNPQTSFEEKKRERPQSLRMRGRTDSTNSAENFVVRQISKDEDIERRESQESVKIDVLQSKASTQIDSPVRSPVVVRSKTLSNSAASMLVLGLPQSGKSSTIASLVQKPEIFTNEAHAPEVVEYTAKIKILDSSNLFSLKIIETPGYTNDHAIVSDAQIMSTLVSYLEDKDGLRGKPPTIILVVMRFDDKRLWNPEDEHPDIVNFLKLIHNFQKYLNDGKCANFVFVLTHFMGGLASEQEQRKPQTKIVELINLIQKYTSLPHPTMVVCAENQQSSEKASLETAPSAVTLTNGETYPYNLIDKIKVLLTKKGRDSVGETVLRTAFGIEYPYSIKECSMTKRIPLVPQSHFSVQQMQKTILHSYLDIQRTEVFTLLEIGWENIAIKIREKFPDSLFTVQQIFQTKKICNFADIPEDPAKVLTLVRQMPSNLAVKDLLIDTLQLKVPACYPALYVGQGFDLWKDTTTNVSPFLLTSGLKTSPVGLIPNELDCKIRDDREICFRFYHSVEEFVSDRLKDLNLRYSISSNSLSTLSNSNPKLSNHRWGYNIIKSNQEVTKSTVATAVIEYRIFQISISPHTDITFKEQFWETLTEIPDLDLKNSTSVSAWKDFFGYWGTHVVKSAFGGGSVEITFRGNVLNKIINSMKKDYIIPSDEYETSKVFQWITGDGLDFVAACGKDVKNDFLQGYDVEAHFHGGDIKYQQINLTKLAGKEEVTNVREEWKESLVLNPVMLETNLVLVPLSHFVRHKSEGLATKIDVALHYFYSDFMVNQGKQSSCNIL